MKTITDLSVLVVSDDPDATRVLAAVLRAMNVTLLTVCESKEVPEYGHYDLVVVSTNGQVQTALDVADHIRGRAAPGPHIVLLALVLTEEKQRCLAWGRFDAIMLKPVTIAALTTQIEHAIERAMRR